MPAQTSKPKPTGKRETEAPTPEERVERDAARYEAIAREHGADLSEEGFDAALRKVGKRGPKSEADKPSDDGG